MPTPPATTSSSPPGRTSCPAGPSRGSSRISRTDLLAHYVELSGLASSRQLQDFMLAAVPPSSGLEKDDEHPPRTTPDLSTLADLEIGSNGWGIGGDRTVSGGGMVLANPHFPWQGELKLYESHIRVEGEVDVYGASLMGVAPVLIGFNKGMAWTHTVSAGKRFTPPTDSPSTRTTRSSTCTTARTVRSSR